MAVRTAAAAHATASDRTGHGRAAGAAGSPPARRAAGTITNDPTRKATAQAAAARKLVSETVPSRFRKPRPYTVSPAGTATAATTTRGTPQRRPRGRRAAHAATSAT